jgi:hypothetical protein
MTATTVNIPSGVVLGSGTTLNSVLQTSLVVSSAYTIAATDPSLIIAQGSGPYNITLPAASLVTGNVFTIKSSLSSVGTVTIVPNGGDLLDNSSSIALARYDSRTLFSNGTGWAVLVTSSSGFLPIGSIIATFPNLTGAYSCPVNQVTADVKGFVTCSGQTIADATSPMNGTVIPNINNGTFLAGAASSGSTTLLGTAAGPSVTLTNTQLPSHIHGSGTYATSIGLTGTAPTSTSTFASATHNHEAPIGQADQVYYKPAWGLGSIQTAITAIQGLGGPSSGGAVQMALTSGPSATAGITITGGSYSLSGSNAVTGSTSSTGTGSSFSILPTYLTAVYVMRVK